MIVPPRLRKMMLAVHVAFSVGWPGAAACFLALAVVWPTSQDAPTVRTTSLVLAPAAWSVLVPRSLGALLTGLVSSLGTTWALLRHSWVLIKLLVNVVAAIFVVRYAQTLSQIAGVAADPTLPDDDVVVLVGTLQRASGGMVLWLGATVLSVDRPRGMTRYGSTSSVPTGTSILRCRRSSRTDARPGSMFELEVGSGR
jgi:hypothetical protein